MSPLAFGDDGEPLINWNWLDRNTDEIGSLLSDHVLMSVVPILIGLAIALPAGLACVRWRRLYAPVTGLTSALYALPAIALFIVLIPFTGLTRTTVMIPLTMYTLSVLLPAVVDGLRSVPEHVRLSAVAMGFGTLRRLVQVELPIALPVVMAGLRVTTVSNISLVSVGALIGVGGLGQLFTDGLNRDFLTPILAGIVLTIALALVADVLLVVLQRLLTPWTRARGGGGRAGRRAAREAAREVAAPAHADAAPTGKGAL
ncbi:ABC transporter permease [Actinomadura macrotermitis]|uniref:Choline transport system permease protein OpuBD n=1 Tax=Actinomadura macrotermitis TaxID=2585200 RepID=A0A7K0BPY9_9ACTN|nr:Choline transport system permease protein OpuBD [Actinomadura macrotermitis]